MRLFQPDIPAIEKIFRAFDNRRMFDTQSFAYWRRSFYITLLVTAERHVGRTVGAFGEVRDQ
jgi:hypothetical protein